MRERIRRRGERDEDEEEFGSAPSASEQILALQSAAGNAAVSRLIARQPISNTVERRPAPGPLTLQQEDDAVEAINDRFDETSIHALQAMLRTPGTGVAGPVDAQAIATFKRQHGAGKSGMVNQKALDAFVAHTPGFQDEAIHLVRRFFKLDTSAEVLSIRFDPTLTVVPSNVAFEGPLRMIVIGPGAFTSATTLRDAIVKEVHEPNPLAHVQPPAPLFGMGGPRILQPNQLTAAVAANARRIRDHRAIVALQMAINASVTGQMDHQTAQFVAQFQTTRRLGLQDGTLDPETLASIVFAGARAGDNNAAIRLALEYHRLDNDAVLDVLFDPSLTTDFDLRHTGPGSPVTLAFGPPIFTRGGPELMHTLASAYEQARLVMNGGITAKFGVREFLGRATQIISRGLPEEHFGGPAGGFIQDATEALKLFQALDASEQRAVWNQFYVMRDKVHERFRAAARRRPPRARRPAARLRSGHASEVGAARVEHDLQASDGRRYRALERRLRLIDREHVGDVRREQVAVLVQVIARGGQSVPAVGGDAGDQRRVLAEEPRERERVVAFVRHAECEHDSARRDRLDGGLERARLMADRLDHDLRAIVAERLRPLGGVAPHDIVDPEVQTAPIDPIHTGHARPARLQGVAEQDPDRSLAEDGDVPAGDVRQPIERVQHSAQRLNHGGVGRAQLAVDLDHVVDARDEVLGEPEMAFGPADHARACRQVAVDHVADDLMQREARRPVEVHERVALAQERRQVRAADPARVQLHQHAFGRHLRHRHLHALQPSRSDHRVSPHRRAA